MRMFASLLIAGLVSFFITYALVHVAAYTLEPSEIRDYVPGKPVFTKPMTDDLAKVIIKQLNEKLDREGRWKRFADGHQFEVPFAIIVIFFMDPINDVLFLIIGAIAFSFTRKVCRNNAATNTAAAATQSE